ncbi:hypothetical protein M0812_17163 [Anaeramoeba flamelloides]|uniref:RGS domain-containing protein n=1 Tax=Anaeramoeba flamelloides TaxID=1746091 RepID=A0AAV7ZBJ1_9EUKA|nr:hypothetical protein M0812_17163 [Anaeramoeba flamelloides]
MTSFSNLNTTSAGTDHNITLYETDDDLDTSNLDTGIKEVERKFFQKKSRISEKFIFESNKKKINNNFENENGSGVSDHGHSNGSDDDYKIKKNYQKFIQIREYTSCEDLFNDALEEIMSLMFSDIWPQFYTSSFYLNMVLEIKQINPDQYLTKNEEDEDEAEDNNNHNNEEDDIKMISLNKISEDTQSLNSTSISQDNTSSDSDNRFESEKEYYGIDNDDGNDNK